MIRNIRQSLSHKLSFSILLLAVVIFGGSMGFQFLHSQRIIRHQAETRAESILNTTSMRLSQYLDEVETATANFEWLILKNMHPDSLLLYSRRIVEENPNITGCSITSEPYYFKEFGRYFSAYSVRIGDSIETVREAEYEYFDKPWYKVARVQGKAVWIDAYDDFNEGTLSNPEVIVSYSKPLINGEGLFVGVVSTDLSLKQLSQAISSHKPYPDSYFILIGDDGHYLLHPDSTKLAKKSIFTDVDPLKHPDLIALGHEMMEGYQDNMEVYINGERCIACYQPQPGTNWSLAFISPESSVFDTHYKLLNILIPLIILSLIIIVLLCRQVVHHASIPLKQLVHQSKQIATGNYDEQIAHSKRSDEIGQLQNSFANMQLSLKQHIGNVERANDELARRIEELKEANELAMDGVKQKAIFIQNMTHQIRTPLNIIMGFGEILRDSRDELPDHEVDSITSMIDRNAVTLSRMGQMLYDCSDQGNVALVRNDIIQCNAAIREAIDNTCRQFTEVDHIHFESTLPDSFCIRTNRLYFFRSIRELLYNAAKYSDGKHISVKVTETQTMIRIVIEDIGPGISEDFYEHMFTPFTKTNDLSEGLGLGLPLTRRHIRNLDGSLYFDKKYHDGCRFIIFLPKIHDD